MKKYFKSFFIHFKILLFTILIVINTSCKESDNNDKSTNELELKERELALKEEEIKKKEDEFFKQNEKKAEQKDIRKNENTYVNIEGKYEGSIKDGTYWTVYINNLNGKKFDGYNVIYWKKSPDGFRTNFSGEYNSSDNSINIYEDRKAKGSGTFYGKVSSDEKTISGKWNRYSDGGSFTWNLTKVK